MEHRSDRFKRAIAVQCHNSWSGWMSHLFGRSARGAGSIDGLLSLEFVREDIERWDRQVKTPFTDLNEEEQASDLREADKFIEQLLDYVRKHGVGEMIGNLADEAWNRGDKGLSHTLHDSRNATEE